MVLFPKPLPEYSTLEDKRPYFSSENEIHNWIINTPDEFDEFYRRLSDEQNIESRKNNLLFRGVNQARFKIFTSAQRYWLSNNWANPSQQEFVKYIDSELSFIKQETILRDFYHSLNVRINDFLLLSFLQHFGGSSPMLDWTHSLDIGLFFAIDGVGPGCPQGNINDYISLYVLDYNMYKDNIVDLIDMYYAGIENAKRFVKDFKDKNPDTVIDCSIIQEIEKFTIWHNPQNPGGDLSSIHTGLLDHTKPNVVKDLEGHILCWSNIRLIAQQGVMLLYTNNDTSLEEYLLQSGAHPLSCINIHKSLCDYIRYKIRIEKGRIYPSEEQIAIQSNHQALNSLRI